MQVFYIQIKSFTAFIIFLKELMKLPTVIYSCPFD